MRSVTTTSKSASRARTSSASIPDRHSTGSTPEGCSCRSRMVRFVGLAAQRSRWRRLVGTGAAIAASATGSVTAKPKQEPAVSVRASIKPDYIICLEDGKKLKMLKRHLMTHYNMTPDQYRARWNLPADYPMVAPNYAEKRRDLAKKIGLGRKPGVKRGRPKKA